MGICPPDVEEALYITGMTDNRISHLSGSAFNVEIRVCRRNRHNRAGGNMPASVKEDIVSEEGKNVIQYIVWQEAQKLFGLK